MAKHRRGRINDAVAQELAVALRELRDPRLIENFVSITRAEVSADLKIARVYFSAMGDVDAAKKALVGATGKFRHHLATTLNLRITPELLFYADGSIEHGAHIARLLADIKEQDEKRAATAASGENSEDADA
ncbi:MAG: 30S ribosome-binding factor RbfA [Clostridia bacterium]|nr:30S ribosome-binding factor RbfA [Clostridia bacterium]